MDIDKNNQILRVAKMYYIDNIPQNRIADMEGISKPTVSRLIKKAHELGYIKITIEQPNAFMFDMENRLKKKYNLKKVKIIPLASSEGTDPIQDLCQALIEDLKELVTDDTTIGLTWNPTVSELEEVVVNAEPGTFKNVNVVSLNGCQIPVVKNNNSSEFMYRFAEMFGGEALQICSPAYFTQKKTTKLVKNDEEIKKILDMAINSDVAVFAPESIIGNENLIAESGLGYVELKHLEIQGAVGMLCGHILNRKGKPVDNTIDQQLVGISLNQLRHIPEKLMLATRKEDAELVEVIISSKYVTRLYITDDVAQRL